MASKMVSVQASSNAYENHSLLTIIEKLYLDPEIADVYFVFGDSDNRERIPAHKSLLAAGSDVFKAMFYGDLKEKGDVKITDASADAFKEFLQFFYRSKVNLTVENAFDVLNLCKKYDVAGCFNICERFLKEELTLTNDSVCSVYGLAVCFELEDLKKMCKSKIMENTEAVFCSASFLDCDRSILSRILKFDELSCSEVNVFHACMNWVKAKTKQAEITKQMIQAHLGLLFYEIHFGSMTLEEFNDLTSSYGKLFSLDEYQEILQMIGLKDFQSKFFKNIHRRVHIENLLEIHIPEWNADAVIECDRYTDNYYLGDQCFNLVEKTTFTANKPVLLGGILCAKLSNYRDDRIPVKMTISEISINGSFKLLYVEKSIPFRRYVHVTAALPTPILIKPGFKYDIRFEVSSKNQVEYFDYNLKDKVQLPGSNVIIEFIGEAKKRGVVRGLRFNLI